MHDGILKSIYVPNWSGCYLWLCVWTSKIVEEEWLFWVIVNWSTKSTHFIPVKAIRTTKQLAQLYMDNIVRYYGIPKEIMSGIYFHCLLLIQGELSSKKWNRNKIDYSISTSYRWLKWEKNTNFRRLLSVLNYRLGGEWKWHLL